MPDDWNNLDSPARVNRIMRVMARAATDQAYLTLCLDKNPAVSRPAIEEEADVKFEADIVVQCFPDRKSVENQIVLQFPEVGDGTTVESPVKNYWLCTYVDYIPAKPRDLLVQGEWKNG